MKTSKTQNGVALITALIITTIAVSLAATVIYRQQIQIRLSSNIAHLEQAYLYANGIEDWAGTILKKSFDDHKDYDSLEDDWATGGKLISLPIDGGVMNGQLFDLQGRINLNSLARPVPPPVKLTNPDGTIINPPPIQKPDIAKITRYRLLNIIQEIDPDSEMGPPQNFAQVVKDWIDKDQINGNKKPEGESSGSGAESPYYQSLEPAYFSANTLMVSPTEIRLLKDMKKEVYTKLLPLVSTLPIQDKTPININTAGEEVLRSLGFDPGAAQDIIQERKINPFKKIDSSFLTNIMNQQGQNIEKKDLDVKSSYFLLKGSVSINNARVFIYSVLKRDKKNGKVSVIMRDFSNP